MRTPYDKCRMPPRMFISKGWGIKHRKSRPPLLTETGKSHNHEEDLVGEVFVYHPENPTPLNHPDHKIDIKFDIQTVKLLYFEQGKKLSTHFHREKKEIFHVVKGELEVTLISDGYEETVKFIEGDTMYIPPCMVHQMKGVAQENILLEVSTLDKPEDSYRIKKGD